VSALRQAETNPPDLVLTAIVLAELDGLGLIRSLRANTALAAIPIAAVSASATEEGRDEALQSGAAAFLCKPVEASLLLRIVGELLGLTWVFEAVPKASVPVAADLLMPVGAGLRELRDLARDGDMLGIRQWADRMTIEDPRLGPLADELRRLARDCQSCAIADLVGAGLTAAAT
jgi:hypothetical protein